MNRRRTNGQSGSVQVRSVLRRDVPSALGNVAEPDDVSTGVAGKEWLSLDGRTLSRPTHHGVARGRRGLPG